MKIILLLLFIIYSSTVSSKENNNKDLMVDLNHSMSPYSLQGQWGLDAITIPQINHNYSTEALGIVFPNNAIQLNMQPLLTKEMTWAQQDGSSNNYRLITLQSTQSETFTSGINIAYSKGDFTAESGVITYTENSFSSGKIYLQGLYRLFNNENIHVALTAKLEALNKNSMGYHRSDNVNGNQFKFHQQQATNAVLGIVSTLTISNNWQIHGMVSSTKLDDKIEAGPFAERADVHKAVIGTKYSF